MRVPRIFVPQSLQAQSNFTIEGNAASHIARVLRMGPGRKLKLFNGHLSGHYDAEITAVDKKNVHVEIGDFIETQLESPLKIHLGQAISKGDRMDFTIQKSVELGVTQITPLWTARCDVKLTGDRLEKKQQHWQQVAISACEQSGRDVVPVVLPAQKLSEWLNHIDSELKWVLDPRGKKDKPPASEVKNAALLVGPEGGLTDEEVTLAAANQFQAKLIGPRVLRTETAALTAITLMQSRWGDFG